MKILLNALKKYKFEPNAEEKNKILRKAKIVFNAHKSLDEVMEAKLADLGKEPYKRDCPKLDNI